MPSYLISFGNSTDGPIGACLRLCAGSKEDAIALAKEVLDEKREREMDNFDDGVPGRPAVEYLVVHINPRKISLEDIEEEEPCYVILAKDEKFYVHELENVFCPECESCSCSRLTAIPKDGQAPTRFEFKCDDCSLNFIVEQELETPPCSASPSA